MRNRRTSACLLIGACAAWGAFAAGGASASSNYGQSLLDDISRTQPNVVGAAIHTTPPKSTASIIAASTVATERGAQSTPADLAAASSGKTTVSPSPSGDRLTVWLPLNDVSHDLIGALRLDFALGKDSDQAALTATAAHIRDALSRKISHAANLFDPYPYDPEMPVAAHTRAQALVDATMAAHPDIEILAIHATPPKGDYNLIAGSNIGRLGKKADNDDMRAVYTGKPNLEVNEGGNRFETEMQLHDHAGQVIGALSVVYAYRQGDDKQALHARAEKIRDALEHKIPSSASLFAPAQAAEK